MNETVRLTEYSKGAGCGCKIAPAVLNEMLGERRSMPAERILVGNSSNDDAAAYDLDGTRALITTADFFAPVIDDPFTFGRIAAANAMSDVYAMGGKPVFAIALLGWPVNKLSAALAAKVMDGAREACASAGIVIAGGHSIDAPEPFFGLAVNGLAEIRNLKRNDTARPGDLLFLTKPLGTGILSTAQKRGLLKAEHLEVMADSMSKINVVGSELGEMAGVTAMTDLTGFGLAGHLLEMCGAKLGAEISLSAIPRFKFLGEYVDMQVMADATFRNWNAYQQQIDAESDAMSDAFTLLCDPQTNGGLLIAVDPDEAEAVKALLNARGYSDHTLAVGRMTERGVKPLRVKK